MVKVFVYDIDWCVEEKDVEDQNEMEKILNFLPKEVHLKIKEYPEVNFYEDEGMLEEAITETLSDKYGWLINSYMYAEE